MDKETRLQLITQLISNQEISTQEELAQLLLNHGLQVTQATISRDLRELKLIKVPTKNGSLKYSFSMDHDLLITEKLRHKLRDALISIEVINYFVLIKTIPGHAHSFGALLDSIEIIGKAGTICGNDTCLIICRFPSDSINVKQKLEELGTVTV
ncbi:MAG: arginine repressor [Neobacillus sp.]|jgi:transcriptional regulator of arginine metabolism